jgi:hypothetical protein
VSVWEGPPPNRVVVRAGVAVGCAADVVSLYMKVLAVIILVENLTNE